MLLSALATLAFATISLSTPLAPHSLRVKDSHHVPAKWSKLDRAPGDRIVNLQIGLKQGDFATLERTLYEVSDPAHPRYGQHLTQDEVKDLVKPADDALDAVHEWLAGHGIGADKLTYSPTRDWIKLSLPISQIEAMLDTQYHVFVHEDGTELMRAPEWSLPLHLHEHIATIQPTNSFLRPMRRSTTVKGWGPPVASGDFPPPVDSASVEAVCNESLVTPLCLRTFYGTVNYTVKAADKNKMALNDFLGEINNRSDTEIYLSKYRPEAAAGAYQFKQISIAGGTLQQTPENETQLESGTGIEGNLDVQTLLGIAWPTPLVAYSTGGLDPDFIPDMWTPENTDEPYLVWLQYILSLPDSELPTVVSTSYADDEQTVSYDYAVQTCNMFAQLGARGVTVLFGSGDEGVGADGNCYSNDGRNASMFLPEYPSSCPYITAVGATHGFNPEVAAYDPRFSTVFTSGGGFSNYFPRPAYQDASVPAYLAKYVGSTYAGLYNTSGRGIPDLAAQGQNYSTVWNGTVRPTDGTSASTPAVAAIIALVNDALISAGRRPLGFINPWLYSGGFKAFNDILSGSSAGCGTDGFPASPEWDAVTGWGTPYFPDILALLYLDESR